MGKKKSPKKRLGWQGVVLAAGVVVAVLVVAGLVLFEGLGGRYVAENILLAPDLLLGKVDLRDSEPMGRIQRSWLFEQVEVVRADPRTGRETRSLLPPEAYGRFYLRLAAERSVREPEEALAAEFLSPGVIRLLLVLKPQGPYAAAFSPQEFQEVQIAPQEGLVRIELHEVNRKGQQWAYFRAPGIERYIR